VSNVPFYVARPIVPEMDVFLEWLKVPFSTRRLTNGSAMVSMLQLRLAELLGCPHLSLVSNGTVAIELAARALNMRRKIITTPFTFPATVNALLWIGIEPVFVDIEDDYLTLDPSGIEAALTPEITGIVGVHVYGNPCDMAAIGRVSEKAGIPVLYDGAHAFDGSYRGESIVLGGDATTLSFHATKIFNTAEGGAVATRRADVNERISLLRNHGIASEDNIVDVGINAKMSELNAAFGLATLDALLDERTRRQLVVSIYTEILQDHELIRIVPRRPQSVSAEQYFAIRLVGSSKTRLRDVVYERLRARGIHARRYFYPLLSEVPAIRAQTTQRSFDLPNATRAASEVLVLPLHGGIGRDDAAMIANAVIEAIDG
jgi:dTDP-4-amino-4,6-dideoxy-D-glucose transaminase